MVAHGSYHSDEGIQLEKFSLEAGAPLAATVIEVAQHARTVAVYDEPSLCSWSGAQAKG